MSRVRVVNLIKTVYENIGTGVVTGSLAYRCYVSRVEETPITGRKRFLIRSNKKAEQESHKAFEKYLKIYAGRIVPPQDPQSQRVMKLAKRLLDANKDPIPEIHPKNWTFTLVIDPTISAFCLSDGNIFISFINELNCSDDELAMTLSHEIAHSLLGHVRESSSHSLILGSFRFLISAIVLILLPINLITLTIYIYGYIKFAELLDIAFFKPNSRKRESEADAVGLQLAAKACFDVRAAVAYWHKHALIDELYCGGVSQSREWRSTHPSYTSRQKESEKQLPSAIRIREQCDCPKLPFFDPRQSDLLKSLEETYAKGKHS